MNLDKATINFIETVKKEPEVLPQSELPVAIFESLPDQHKQIIYQIYKKEL